jgi:hypothetical protein
MRVMVVTLLVAAAGAAFAGPTYRWVDEQGQVHYSDRAVPGAQEVKIEGVQSYTPPAIDTMNIGSTSATEPAAAADEPPPPTSVSITAPRPEETLWNLGGRLPVAVTVEPALQGDQRVNVYLDGSRVIDGEPGRLAFELDEVWRGEHTLTAAVEDANGMEILRSEPVRFYVQHTSVQQPRVAPAPRN